MSIEWTETETATRAVTLAVRRELPANGWRYELATLADLRAALEALSDEERAKVRIETAATAVRKAYVDAYNGFIANLCEMHREIGSGVPAECVLDRLIITYRERAKMRGGKAEDNTAHRLLVKTRDKALAEVERLTKERDEARAMLSRIETLMGSDEPGCLQEWEPGEDLHDAIMRALSVRGRELDKARAEVERLTKERDEFAQRPTLEKYTNLQQRLKEANNRAMFSRTPRDEIMREPTLQEIEIARLRARIDELGRERDEAIRAELEAAADRVCTPPCWG